IRIGAEVISADSRQVYRGMDLGTGKDLEDYIVGGKKVPYHLINIVEPGTEYNVYRFQKDFLAAYNDIINRGKQVILCGGTGMYLESVLLEYDMTNAPLNKQLRATLDGCSTEELIHRLENLKNVHNITDTEDRGRLIRAIEIAETRDQKSELKLAFPEIKHHVFGIDLPREVIRSRITDRLKQRLEEGMVEEVKHLIDSGITPEQLEFYGLEYKYLTQYVTGKINYNEMFRKLNTAIHQFAKRQMTWFRRMEKRGVPIRWIDGTLSLEDRIREFREVDSGS
ncbi:MAG: tRNA (adenosine(37)-N6)-dimethylallyltransferase MiaA, partial [Bacteroidales bacterium]|nr:tRNA (adenosine(37)-N6)-dimethylallyltransferase MiaA [Bacteroidales bacterium]